MMQQIHVEDLSKIQGIVERRIENAKATGRTSFPHFMAMATLMMSQGRMAIWVDDKDEPKAILAASSGKYGILQEQFCFVNGIYAEDNQKNYNVMKEMVKTAELWAKDQNCDSIVLSSWRYKGCAGTGKLWKRLGYEVQETFYVKKVT